MTLEGFNEIDSFVASYILSRAQREDWTVAIASPTAQVTSKNGVTITAQMQLDELQYADAVIIGSGIKTREYAANADFLESLRLDPSRQLIGSQCSGALLLDKLGLLADVPVCTDLTTKSWVIEAGANVIDRPFFASGNVATAGGCLSGQYLAAWINTRLVDADAARDALHFVAPVGEKELYIDRAMGHVLEFTELAVPNSLTNCEPTNGTASPAKWPNSAHREGRSRVPHCCMFAKVSWLWLWLWLWRVAKSDSCRFVWQLYVQARTSCPMNGWGRLSLDRGLDTPAARAAPTRFGCHRCGYRSFPNTDPPSVALKAVSW